MMLKSALPRRTSMARTKKRRATKKRETAKRRATSARRKPAPRKPRKKPPAGRPALVKMESLLGPKGLPDPAIENLAKIEHIVVLMMENRSFDHLMGYLKLDNI